MTPHKQLFRHNPAAGVYGDCCRTVYACLLDKHPSEVPHFGEVYWNDTDAWAKAEDAYLASEGVSLVRIAYNGEITPIEQVHGWAKHFMPGLYYILHGKSSNETDHVVICCDGEVVHDPAQDSSGVIGPASDGYYWVYIFASSKFSRQEVA